jgi:trigger factor
VETQIRKGDRSTIVLEVQITDQELRRAIDDGVRHLSQRTRVPGFRPGKAPRTLLERALGIDRSAPGGRDPVYDEAREHLYERTVISALEEADADPLELPAEPEWSLFEEGTGAAYSVRIPVRPTVALGDYQGYPFEPHVAEVTEKDIDQVVDQLRDQYAALVPVEGRGAQDGDYAVVGFTGRRNGEPVEGLSVERFPLVIGGERMVPGFETNLVGMAEDEEKTFRLTFPADYAETELAGQEVEFEVRLRELRERRLPEADDAFAGMVGAFEDMAALRAELRVRMERNALDRARHEFTDRVIEYATANATVELPDVLVDREVEIMLDELRLRVAEQGIALEDYLRVTERDEAAVRTEYRDPAERRVKVLLVLGAIADAEGVTIPDEMVEAEVGRARAEAGPGAKLAAYLDSDRGRAYIRSALRRSQTAELLVDRWIAAHPAFAAVQHVHGAPAPAESTATTETADPLASVVPEDEPDTITPAVIAEADVDGALR